MYGPANAVLFRESSSMTAIAATMSMPLPPNFSSTVNPQTPRSANFRKTSFGKRHSRSHSRTLSLGASFSAKRRRVSRSIVMCSGSSLKYIISVHWLFKAPILGGWFYLRASWEHLKHNGGYLSRSEQWYLISMRCFGERCLCFLLLGPSFKRGRSRVRELNGLTARTEAVLSVPTRL